MPRRTRGISPTDGIVIAGGVNPVQRARNRTKSKVRAKVEHGFGVIKRVFGFSKVRYRGLDKNAHRLFVTCALANLFMVRERLPRNWMKEVEISCRSERFRPVFWPMAGPEPSRTR